MEHMIDIIWFVFAALANRCYEAGRCCVGRCDTGQCAPQFPGAPRCTPGLFALAPQAIPRLLPSRDQLEQQAMGSVRAFSCEIACL